MINDELPGALVIPSPEILELTPPDLEIALQPRFVDATRQPCIEIKID